MNRSQAPILFIEDNRDDRELTIKALVEQGVRNRIVVAKDGEEALDYFDGAEKERPCLVLLDLKLPKVSGLDVLRAIRANPSYSAVPVVIFTSSKEQRDLVESYELGANSYVQKPISVAQFDQALRTLGIYWLSFNQTPSRI